jgi:intracellular sulfur oxidation DsrE/DsrF family protein
LLTVEGVRLATYGGQIWACGACTKPRGIGEADLIPGAKIVTAANVVNIWRRAPRR